MGKGLESLAGAWDRMLCFLGFGPDEEELEEEFEEAAAMPGPVRGGREVAGRRSGRAGLGAERAAGMAGAGGGTNVVPLPAGGTPRQPFKVLLVEPRSFDDVQSIVDQLKARRPIILNLEGLEKEVAHRILNFLHGAIYALGGETQKIATGIFFFAPPGVDVASFSRGLGEAASGGAYDPASVDELLSGAARFPLPGESLKGEESWDLGAGKPRTPAGGHLDFDWRRPR